MEQKYLIDTNVIIDFFGNKLIEKAKVFLTNIEINISAVTKIEILGWKDASAHQLAPLNAFMETVNILSIDEYIINKTISLRQLKKIALGDAIIAATAMVHNLTLVTRNISDFKNINDLKILSPSNL